MAFTLVSGVITQSGTDTNLAGITSVNGLTVNVSANGHKTYQVPTTIGLLTITGTLSWDSDYETLECSESTRIEVFTNGTTDTKTATGAWTNRINLNYQ